MKSRDNIGPVWAAQTAEQAAHGTGLALEMSQRRAYEIVSVLIRALGQLVGK